MNIIYSREINLQGSISRYSNIKKAFNEINISNDKHNSNEKDNIYKKKLRMAMIKLSFILRLKSFVKKRKELNQNVLNQVEEDDSLENIKKITLQKSQTKNKIASILHKNQTKKSMNQMKKTMEIPTPYKTPYNPLKKQSKLKISSDINSNNFFLNSPSVSSQVPSALPFIGEETNNNANKNKNLNNNLNDFQSKKEKRKQNIFSNKDSLNKFKVQNNIKHIQENEERKKARILNKHSIKLIEQSEVSHNMLLRIRIKTGLGVFLLLLSTMLTAIFIKSIYDKFRNNITKIVVIPVISSLFVNIVLVETLMILVFSGLSWLNYEKKIFGISGLLYKVIDTIMNPKIKNSNMTLIVIRDLIKIQSHSEK